MESANKLLRIASPLLAVTATAAMLYFGDGLIPRWPLMWFVPVPVLLFALRRPAWQAGLAAFGAWLGCLNLWHYFRASSMHR